MKIFFSLLAPAVLLASTLTASPQPELGKWWKNSELVKKLQLSEIQVEQIERTFLSFRPTLANLNSELKSREAELRNLMKADPVDDARVLTQNDLIAQSRAALEKANSAMMLAIRKELSREQWDKLQEIRDSRRGSSSLAGPLHSAKARNPAYPGDKVYVVGNGVKPPTVVYQPMPSYTQEARDARAEGIILLEAIIRKDGNVTDLKVLRGLGHGLDERAIDTIKRKWQFEPGTLNGEPVSVQANIEISFRLY